MGLGFFLAAACVYASGGPLGWAAVLAMAGVGCDLFLPVRWGISGLLGFNLGIK